MTTKKEQRRKEVSKNNNTIKLMAEHLQREFIKGELVEATEDYITDEGPMDSSVVKKYGIILEPKTAMYGDDAPEHAARVQWADNSEETVWQFEIQGVVKTFQEKK